MNDGSKGPAPDSAFSPDGDPLSAVRRPRRGRTIGVIAVTAVVVGAACVTWWIGRGDGQEADAGTDELPSTDVIRVRDLTESTRIDGVLAYEDAESVSASRPGVVVSIPEEGVILERGALLFVVDEEASDQARLAAQQRVTSARASLAAAQVQWENLTEPPGAGDIASAEAAVAQARDALDGLTEPVSAAELAVARAALSRAEEAYRTLFDGPDAAAVDSAEAAVTQAEQRLSVDQQTRDLALIDMEAAQSAYCGLDPVPVGGLCGPNDIPLSDRDVEDLIDAIAAAVGGGDTATAATIEGFVAASADYRAADAAVDVSAAALDSAELRLADLVEPPTQGETQSALAEVLTAEDRLQALLDGPTELQIQQAEAGLAVAEGRLADLQAGASSSQRSQAGLNLESAQLSLQAALDDLVALDGDPETAVLMYGEVGAWRSLSVASEPGADIEQLEMNLLALGYDADGLLVVDNEFDEATASSVASFQASLGLEETGEVERGWVVFVPGPAQVTSMSMDVGDDVVPGVTIFELTAVQRATPTLTGGEIVDEMVTSQRVTTQLDLVDRDILDVGSQVLIELPDGTAVPGEVASIGKVPVIVPATAQQPASSYVDVVIALGESVDPIWTGATVDVEIVTEIAAQVLSAPVSALLALQEGGYAVEVVEPDGSTRLIGIETGMFAGGFVEIFGDGLEEGMTVVVP